MVEVVESAEVSFGSNCLSSSSKARFSCDETKDTFSGEICGFSAVSSTSDLAPDFVSLGLLSNSFGKFLEV